MENVRISSGQVFQLLGEGSNADGVGGGIPKASPLSAFQGVITGTGSVSATLTIEGSNDNVNWVPALVSMSLSGTNTDTKGGVLEAPYKYVRARIASLSGTGALVTCSMGV